MSANEFVPKSMNHRPIRKFLVHWLLGGEGPEFPWQDGDEALGPLAFGPGELFGGGLKKTLRWNWEPYELGTGVPDGADGEIAVFDAARHKFYGVDTEGDPVTLDHEFNTWPLVQCIERGGGVGGVPWTKFDAFTVEYAITLDSITVDFGGAFEGIVVVVG